MSCKRSTPKNKFSMRRYLAHSSVARHYFTTTAHPVSEHRRFVVLRTAVIALLFFAVNSCFAQEKQTLRVLFIGNSLTYSNDLPAIVASFAAATKQERFDYKTIAFPDFSLEDHWKQGEARKEIAKGHWDFVVLQQGPSSLPESRTLLREYVSKFAEEIKRAGARTAIYMVWPAVSRQQDFDRAMESYTLAAADVGALLLPVGAAWRVALKTNSALPLYSQDQFHPSELGSLFAAWIIFKQLYDNPKVPMPDTIRVGSNTIALKPSDVAALSAAAEQVLNIR